MWNEDNEQLLTENERDEWYKSHIDKVKEISYDKQFTKSNMQHLEESMDNVILDAYENVNKVDEKKIGGDNRLECFAHKNMGVCVTNKFSAQPKGTSVTQYLFFGKYTSTSDYSTMKLSL